MVNIVREEHSPILSRNMDTDDYDNEYGLAKLVQEGKPERIDNSDWLVIIQMFI
jgi:hypothetical protein